MSRIYKTSQKKRTDYIYYSADGTKITITPGEDNVAATHIELLHEMDDEAVDAQRREDYRIAAYLGDKPVKSDANQEKEDKDINLADESYNPEKLLIEAEEEDEHEALLRKLRAALETLTDRQREIYKLSYHEGLTNVAIGKQLGISEAMVRKHLKKMHAKLLKILS